MRRFLVSGISRDTKTPTQHVVAANDNQSAYAVTREAFDQVHSIVETEMAETWWPGVLTSAAGGGVATDVPTTIPALLRRYVGMDVAINLENPTSFQKASLTAVTDESLVFRRGDHQLTLIPTRMVLRIDASDRGFRVGGLFSTARAPVMIEIWHLVVYKGFVGLSWEV